MNKKITRNEIEERINLIRETHRILSSENSRDDITDGLLGHIGLLLDEVDYWRSEYMRVQNLRDTHGSPGYLAAPVDNVVLNDENISYECPNCGESIADDNYDGITWDSVGCMINNGGYTVDIGYVHCSGCGKDSPLYAGKETAFRNWCSEIKK